MAMPHASAATGVPFDDFIYLNAVLDEEVTQDARRNHRGMKCNSASKNKQGVQPMSKQRKNVPDTPRLATTAEASLSQLTRDASKAYTVTENAAQTPYPVLRDGGSQSSLANVCNEAREEEENGEATADNDDVYLLGDCSSFEVHPAKDLGRLPSRTHSPLLATPGLVDGVQPRDSSDSSRSSSNSGDNNSSRVDTSTNEKTSKTRDCQQTNDRRAAQRRVSRDPAPSAITRLSSQPSILNRTTPATTTNSSKTTTTTDARTESFVPPLATASEMTTDSTSSTSTQHTNVLGLTLSSSPATSLNSQLHVTTTTAPSSGTTQKDDRDIHDTALNTRDHPGSVAVGHAHRVYRNQSNTVHGDGRVVPTKGVPEALPLSAKSFEVGLVGQATESEETTQEKEIICVRVPAPPPLKTTPAKKTMCNSTSAIHKPETQAKEVMGQPYAPVHETELSQSPAARPEIAESGKMVNLSAFTSVVTLAAGPPHQQQQYQQHPPPSPLQRKTRNRHDNNYSVTLNSLILPIATPAPERSLLSTHFSTQKIPVPTVMNGTVNTTTTNPTANTGKSESNLVLPPLAPTSAAVSPKCEAENHPVVFSPPTAAQPADPPVRTCSSSSERGLLHHAQQQCNSGEVSFDMWEYMNVDEPSQMYDTGNGSSSNSDSGNYRTNEADTTSSSAGAKEGDQPTQHLKHNNANAGGLRAAPSEVALMNWAANTTPRRSPVTSVASRPGSSSATTEQRSPGAQHYFQSFGYQCGYGFDAASRGSTAQSTHAGGANQQQPTKDAGQPENVSRRGNAGRGARQGSAMSSTSTIGDLESEGSYVSFFNSFLKHDRKPPASKAAASETKQRVLAAAVQLTPSSEAPKGNKEGKENSGVERENQPAASHEEIDNNGRQKNCMSEVVKSAEPTPCAGASASIVATVVQVGSPQVSSGVASFDEKRPSPRNCLDSFVFTEQKTSPGTDTMNNSLETARKEKEHGNCVPLSAAPPPYPSIFTQPNALPEKNVKAQREAVLNSSEGNESTSSNTTAWDQKSNVHCSISPLWSSGTTTTTIQNVECSLRPPQLTPVVGMRADEKNNGTNNIGSDDDDGQRNVVESSYAYSSQLQLPMLVAPSSPQGDKVNESTVATVTGAAAVDPAAMDQVSKMLNEEGFISPLHTKHQANTAPTASSLPSTRSPPTNAAARQHGFNARLRGEAVEVEKTKAAGKQVNHETEENTAHMPSKAQTHDDARMSEQAKSVEASLDERSSNDSHGLDGYVYNNDASSSSDAEDPNDNGDERTGEAVEETVPQQQQDEQEAFERDNNLTRRLKAARSNPSPPRGFHARGGGQASPQMTPPSTLHNLRYEANNTGMPKDWPRRDFTRSPNAPRPFPPSRPVNGKVNNNLNLSGPHCNYPVYPPVQRGADRLPPPIHHSQQQQHLNDSVTVHSKSGNSSLKAPLFNGLRGVMKGFALPQPVGDLHMLPSSTTPQPVSGNNFSSNVNNSSDTYNDGQIRSELPSLDANGATGLPGGFAIFRRSSSLTAQHPAALTHSEDSGLHNYNANDTTATASAQPHEQQYLSYRPTPHPPPAAAHVLDCTATTASFQETPSVSQTHQWVQQPSKLLNCAPAPPPSRPHVFTELEEAQRHVGAKWFKFVALEIRWVPSPGLPPDERGSEGEGEGGGDGQQSAAAAAT